MTGAVIGDGKEMGIMRLFDPASTFNKVGNENCSFPWLADNLTPCDTLDEFKSKIQEVKAKLVPMKEFRNKVLGHTDMITHTVKNVQIPTIILTDLDTVIMKDLPSLLNIISTHITNIPNQPYTLYTDVVRKGGAYELMYFIKEGIKTRTERIKTLGLPRVNHGLGEVAAAKGMPSQK